MAMLSLRARLTLWYSVVLVVVLAFFGGDMLLAQERLGRRRMDEQLVQLQARLAKVLREELGEGDVFQEATSEAVDTAAGPGLAVAVLDDHRRAIVSRLSGVSLSDLVPSSLPDGVPTTVQASPGPWRVLARPEQVTTKTGQTTTVLIVVGRPLSDIRRELRSVQEAMEVGFPIALLLSGAGGLWLASVALRPITRMAEQAARIQPTSLEDLGDTDRRDELGQLARSFNGLVARLRAALQTQRQFMADASHELRTPLSVVRTAADVALNRDHRDESDYRETLAIVRDESRRLSRLVDDMLTLARADAGGQPLRTAPLYLDEVVAECRRAVAVLAAERNISIGTGPADAEIAYQGDEDLLRQMILNLLQNAVQHTLAGGTVSVALQPDGTRVTIRVVDTGDGIPPADRERIFDRFVQLDPARFGSGTGLGLPIAKWIAEAHGGTLALESSGPGGSVFLVSLPRS